MMSRMLSLGQGPADSKVDAIDDDEEAIAPEELGQQTQRLPPGLGLEAKSDEDVESEQEEEEEDDDHDEDEDGEDDDDEEDDDDDEEEEEEEDEEEEKVEPTEVHRFRLRPDTPPVTQRQTVTAPAPAPMAQDMVSAENLIDFSTEELVTSAAEIENARTLLGRREEVLSMFRTNADIVHKQAWAQVRTLFNPIFACYLMVAPCMVRGARQAENAGRNTSYLITSKGIGTFAKRIDEDSCALPRNVGYTSGFIPWDDIILITTSEEGGETCCAASYLVVSISYSRIRRRHSGWPLHTEGQPETINEWWYVNNADEVCRLLNEYCDRFSSVPRHNSSFNSMTSRGSLIENPEGPIDSMDSLRSLRNRLDSMLPPEEREVKRIFVVNSRSPHAGETVHVTNDTEWGAFIESIEISLSITTKPSSVIFLRKGEARVKISSVADLEHDDRVFVEV